MTQDSYCWIFTQRLQNPNSKTYMHPDVQQHYSSQIMETAQMSIN